MSPKGDLKVPLSALGLLFLQVRWDRGTELTFVPFLQPLFPPLGKCLREDFSGLVSAAALPCEHPLGEPGVSHVSAALRVTLLSP